MPVAHSIDSKNKLIISSCSGEATDQDFFEALTKYQLEIRSNPEHQSYDEIVDCSKVTSFKLTTEGIKRLGQIASITDHVEITTKAAFVVKSSLAYGLARMYEIYRNLLPNSNKEIKVFKNVNDAYMWIGVKK